MASRAFLLWFCVGLLLSLSLFSGAQAHHKAICNPSGPTAYKYENRFILWYNGASNASYSSAYNEEAQSDPNSWENYTNVELDAVPTAGTTDHLNAYSGYYGNTTWDGKATAIRRSGCTNLQFDVLLNRTNLDNSGDYKKFVACHEIGHVLSLNDRLDSTETCLYHGQELRDFYAPNQHDKDIVNSMYF